MKSETEILLNGELKELESFLYKLRQKNQNLTHEEINLILFNIVSQLVTIQAQIKENGKTNA